MRRWSRGEGRLGCIFYLLLLFAVVYAGYKFIPVKIATMQLEDYMKELALTQPRAPGSVYVREIKNKADDLRLPIEKKDIKVKKNLKRVIIDIEFPVVVDLIVTDYTWNIDLHLDRDIFLM